MCFNHLYDTDKVGKCVANVGSTCSLIRAIIIFRLMFIILSRFSISVNVCEDKLSFYTT